MWYSTQVWRDHLLFHTIQSQGLAKRTQHFNLKSCKIAARNLVVHTFSLSVTTSCTILDVTRSWPVLQKNTWLVQPCSHNTFAYVLGRFVISRYNEFFFLNMADNNAPIEQSKTLKKWTERETTSLIDVSRGIPAFVIYSKSWTSLTQERKKTIFS